MIVAIVLVLNGIFFLYLICRLKQYIDIQMKILDEYISKTQKITIAVIEEISNKMK